VIEETAGTGEMRPDAPSAVPPILASRADRLAAEIVDGAIGLVVAPFGILNGFWSAALHGQPIPPGAIAQMLIVGWVWFFLVNGYLLMRYGQTVGKRFISIRICESGTFAVPQFWRLLVRIMAPPLVSLIVPLGGLLTLADDLFIFRPDRRCIHDLVVGTRVVKC
jgi:uncharacterized RDD family membrane protein YckC